LKIKEKVVKCRKVSDSTANGGNVPLSGGIGVEIS
jgi:hypothetical protein